MIRGSRIVRYDMPWMTANQCLQNKKIRQKIIIETTTLYSKKEYNICLRHIFIHTYKPFINSGNKNHQLGPLLLPFNYNNKS